MEETVNVSRQDADTDDLPAVQALVKKKIDIIKADKTAFKKAFERMARDMHVAMHGAEKEWGETKYRANIAGRHVKQKTASLYAKNPKATARRPETLDFAIWDENVSSLVTALQTVQLGMQAHAQAQAEYMAQTAQVLQVGGVVPPPPEPPPEVTEAQELLADFHAGMERRGLLKKIGKTLEILFGHAMREQKPVDFKTGMKQCVRRSCTAGVGYVELGVQRVYGPRPGLTEQLADARARLDHLSALQRDAAEGEIEADDAEMAELQFSISSLEAEPEIVIREGLIFDFPQATKVIPDRMCRHLVGFIGASHVTVEYLYTREQVEELFPGVDLKENYTGYGLNGKVGADGNSANMVQDKEDNADQNDRGMVCVWKHSDKPSGLVYYLADGYPKFLREPAAPDVFVEDFWALYALTFNAVESEDELFPPSDVTLLLDMQREYNRSRQGKSEHRKAARPRWAASKGAMEPEDIETFKRMDAFEVALLNKDPQTKLADVLEVVPVPGVDPNLYDTGEIFSDIQLVGGTQESSYGGLAQASATESAIAANSTASTDASSVDDLDAFLTCVARAGGQILLREMSEEKVREIVGPGAVWPHLTLAQIASEIFLEVEAGSTGKPNQAIEIQNWKELLPFLLQMPGIAPEWLARETLRRLDDRMDLTEALAAGLPSIVTQNRGAQVGTGDPATDPAAQGASGVDNGPQVPGQTGSEPAFGSNQV